MYYTVSYFLSAMKTNEKSIGLIIEEKYTKDISGDSKRFDNIIWANLWNL